MKRKTIKKIASLLALTLTATAAFAGCGKKDQTNNDKQSSSAESSVQTPEKDADPTEEPAPEKAGKVKVMVYDRATIPASEGDLNNNRWTEWIRENCNNEEVEFVNVPKAEAAETMSLLFASGEGPDVYAHYEDAMQFYQNGMMLEITDEMLDKMPNYKALVERYPSIEKVTTIDGKRMMIGNVGDIAANHTMVFRQDWLDNLGLQVPTTADEFYDVLYAFTYNDPDGNGVNDTWGINLTADGQRILSHMFGFGNPEKYTVDADGNVIYAWDNIEAWLGFCKKLVDNKLVNPDFLTMKGDDDQADFLNGRIGFWLQGRLTNSSKHVTYGNIKDALPDATIATCALPVTEFGQFTTYTSGGGGPRGFISSMTKDVDAALAYVDFLVTPDVTNYLSNGPEDVYYHANEYGTFTVVDPEKNAVEFDYASDYHIIGGRNEESAMANSTFNQFLSGSDESLYGLGDLIYQFNSIANNKETYDPRKWLKDAKPALSEDLILISSTTDKIVDDILKAGMADSSKSAADVIKEAKDAWTAAGGEAVDAYYAEYYKNNADIAILPDSYNDIKADPVMTEASKANSSLFN